MANSINTTTTDLPELPFTLFEGYSAADSLSLSYDGRIPSGYMDLARTYDAAVYAREAANLKAAA
jgi:hypothetical protein